MQRSFQSQLERPAFNSWTGYTQTDRKRLMVEQLLKLDYLKKVSIGRYIEVELEEGPEEEVKKNIQEAIDKLLYNSIIEDYEVIYETKNAK